MARGFFGVASATPFFGVASATPCHPGRTATERRVRSVANFTCTVTRGGSNVFGTDTDLVARYEHSVCMALTKAYGCECDLCILEYVHQQHSKATVVEK